jgi:hypothetical protein
MIIHTEQECEKWLNRKAFYPVLTKVLLFEPKIKDDKILVWQVADIGGKTFQHDIERIKLDFKKICRNYPKAQELLENLDIFICPKPSADTANACANDDYICYFGRSTQIPWCITDYVTVHELGHIVQKRLCHQRKNIEKMKEYLELRNAPKAEVEVYDDEKGDYVIKMDYVFLYGDGKQKNIHEGTWDTNPSEWFAEDFRYLFGIDQGDKFWGLPITPPDDKIKEFMLSL